MESLAAAFMRSAFAGLPEAVRARRGDSGLGVALADSAFIFEAGFGGAAFAAFAAGFFSGVRLDAMSAEVYVET
jgi:hypothetical protein